MLSNFYIFKADNGDIHLTRSLTARDGEHGESVSCSLTLTPPMAARLAEFFRNEERAMLGSIHADGGVAYETWLAARQMKVEDDSVPATLPAILPDVLPATDAEYAEYLAGRLES